MALALGLPLESEPNDDVAHANLLTVGSYVVGTITTPDVRDMYSVTIATPGTYTFETSGVVGSCGLGIELDTFMSVTSSGQARRDERQLPRRRSLLLAGASALTPGIYYVTVSGSSVNLAFTAARSLPPPGARRQLATAKRERTNGGRETRDRRSHPAFGFELRYFSSQPWTSRHHRFGSAA